MTVATERTIAANGEPVTTLPEWGDVVTAPGVTFILHPPLDFELAYRVDRYVLFLAFSSAATDASFGDEPMRRVRLRSGGATLVTPGTCVRVCQREPIEFLILSIDPEHMARVADRAAAGRAWHVETLVDHMDPAITAVAAEIRRSLLADPLTEPTYLEALADAIISRLVCRFLRETIRRPGGESLAPATLTRILRYIEANLDETIRVETLAEIAKVSRSHFSRAFQRMTGDPPQRFILKRRLCRARDLISAGASNLSAIAAEAGFSSHAHLSTVFRKEIGISPRRYRAAFNPSVTSAEAPDERRLEIDDWRSATWKRRSSDKS